MRIVMPIKQNRKICKNMRKIDDVLANQPNGFNLIFCRKDGGYFKYNHDLYLEINRWLKDNYGLELTYYDGCFHPFLTEEINE